MQVVGLKKRATKHPYTLENGQDILHFSDFIWMHNITKRVSPASLEKGEVYQIE